MNTLLSPELRTASATAHEKAHQPQSCPVSELVEARMCPRAPQHAIAGVGV